MIDVKVTVFFLMFKCYNTLKCTLANAYTSSNEISKKNGTVRGDCIACDALFFFKLRRLLGYLFICLFIFVLAFIYEQPFGLKIVIKANLHKTF